MKTTTTILSDRQGLKFVPSAWPADSTPVPAKIRSHAGDYGSRSNACPAALAYANGYFLAKPYAVDLWCSHPDEDNDDCWTGDSFATLVEADDAFANWMTHFPRCTSGGITHVVLSAWTGRVIEGCPEYERISVKQVVSDAEIRRIRRKDDADDRAWQREIAMQAGMGMGVEAYNDEMGWG